MTARSVHLVVALLIALAWLVVLCPYGVAEWVRVAGISFVLVGVALLGLLGLWRPPA